MKLNLNISNANLKCLMLDRMNEFFKEYKLKKGIEITISTIDNEKYQLKLSKNDKVLYMVEDSMIDTSLKNFKLNIEKMKNYIDDKHLLEFWKDKSLPSDKPPYIYYGYDKHRANELLIHQYKLLQDLIDYEEFFYESEDCLFNLEFFGAKVRVKFEFFTSKKPIYSDFVYFKIDDKPKDILKKISETIKKA